MIVFPELKTSRCHLTQASLNDADALCDTINTEECQRNMPEFYWAFHQKKFVFQLIQVFSDNWRSGTGILWTIQGPLGFAGFVGIMDIPDHATLFYATHPIHRNKGYMKECVTECLDYFSKQFSGIVLHSVVFDDNIPSLKILSETMVEIEMRHRSNL